MTRLGSVLLVGLIAILAALGVAAWPLHARGVTGNALSPHYHSYYVGISSYDPIPAHVSLSYLRHHGVRVPQDVVADRRRAAAAVLVFGLVLAGGVAQTRMASATAARWARA